uniref:Protein kinase domain-containing protein n=1 Tax=Alexandrium monilatum TaxID=311494 RepID=A0A7S4RVI8_9DINO
MLQVEPPLQAPHGQFEPISPPHAPGLKAGMVTEPESPSPDAKVFQLSGSPGNSIQDIFEHGSLLGSGTFGCVFAATERATGEEAALKVIPKGRQYPGLFEDLGGPLIQCLLAFRHENVVRYRLLAEDASMVYVAMDRYSGCDLFDYFVENCPCSREKTLSTARQVLSALTYIHDVAGVVHCDVKPENFIFSTSVSQTLKLIDFGSAMTVDVASKDASGTLGFCAPEVFTNGCSCASDVFSAGIIIFNALTGQWPEPMDQSHWQEADESESLAAYRGTLERMAPDAVQRWLEAALPGTGWASLRGLLGGLLHGHASERPSAASACEQLPAAFAATAGWRDGKLLPLAGADVATGSEGPRNAMEGEVRRCSSLLGAASSRSDSRGRLPSAESDPPRRRICSRHYSMSVTDLLQDDC